MSVFLLVYLLSPSRSIAIHYITHTHTQMFTHINNYLIAPIHAHKHARTILHAPSTTHTKMSYIIDDSNKIRSFA